MFDAAVERVLAPIPRRRLAVGLPLAYALLTGLFVCSGFPYDRVADGLARHIETATGVPVRIGELAPHLGLLGVGIEARDLVATPAGGPALALDRLLLRPAWSWSWLSGEPSVYAELDANFGSAAGAIRLGAERAVEAELRAVDLAWLASAAALPVVALQGAMDADIDLAFPAAGPHGRAELVIRNGSVSLPGSPIGLPFETVIGEFELEAGAALQVVQLALEGPLLTAVLSGSIDLRRGALNNAALQLEATLSASDALGRAALQGLGVRLDREGRANFRIGGTLQAPRLIY